MVGVPLPLSPRSNGIINLEENREKIETAQSVMGKILCLKDLREGRCDKFFRISQLLVNCKVLIVNNLCVRVFPKL